MNGPGSQLPRRFSRRQQRTLVAGAVCACVILVIGVVATRRSTPQAYDPGRPAEGITSALARSRPEDYPRVTFTDAAPAAAVVFSHFPGTRTTQLPEDMGSGAAWGDYDNDGDDDLFIVNTRGPLSSASDAGMPPSARDAAGGPGTSRLFRNDGGSFVDVTVDAGVARALWGMGAAWGDADGDGWLDLLVTAFGPLTFYRNRGDGTFEDHTTASGLGQYQGFWTGASWADYDRDGDVDVYVCGYVRYRQDREAARQGSMQFAAEVPFALNPSSYPPDRNLLLRNDGRGRFVDQAERAGVANVDGRSLSAAWADFDEDGWLDLYVANDVSDNALFRGLGQGRFENVSHQTWVADPRGAMGLAVGDWDRDGDFDIFVTHWLAQENALFANMRIGTRGAAPGRMVFMDVADQVGLGQASLDYVKWGTAFVDYDNDGRSDLLSVNGSTFQDPDDQRRLIPMRHQLFWNRSDLEGFFDVADVSGAVLTEATVGRGAALSDYDNDGDVDVLVVNHGGPARLWRNDGGNARRWLKIRARGRTNRFALGAIVEVTSGAVTQRQQIGSQPSYLSQHSLTMHFGLGAAETVDTVVVRFPSGRVVRQNGVRTNQTVVIEEPPS